MLAFSFYVISPIHEHASPTLLNPLYKTHYMFYDNQSPREGSTYG